VGGLWLCVCVCACERACVFGCVRCIYGLLRQTERVFIISVLFSVCKDLRHVYMSPQTIFPVYLMFQNNTYFYRPYLIIWRQYKPYRLSHFLFPSKTRWGRQRIPVVWTCVYISAACIETRVFIITTFILLCKKEFYFHLLQYKTRVRISRECKIFVASCSVMLWEYISCVSNGSHRYRGSQSLRYSVLSPRVLWGCKSNVYDCNSTVCIIIIITLCIIMILTIKELKSCCA
jgi:hypothetical protein